MNGRRRIESGIALLAGVTLGLGAFTFVYAKGYSYLLNDPAACANCHVMREYLDGWIKGSHRSVATCNDCHAPHDLLGKYITKARNGFMHSLAFTSGRFPDAIEITDWNRRITEAACRHCHEDVVLAMDGPHHLEKVSCLRCHSAAGHM
jgi:cytochrome c nitrite reductase small subunit